jgi:CDP-ribitol ribitolphosphotransferase
VVNAGGVDILDLLPLCDVVITDYSAVAFEACVLDLPVFFWVYDIDDYQREHGLNIDLLREAPGLASRDLDAIASRIESDDSDPLAMRSFKQRYVPATDGRCTERIADVILDSLNSTGA